MAEVEPELNDSAAELRARVAASSIRDVHVLAWRDLDDPEAGGSELHADRIFTAWAQAGINVTQRTSMVPGAPRRVRRHGYAIDRWSGRYSVFPSVIWEGLRSKLRRTTPLVEIWNGMPFFSPLWHRGPRIVFLHHVHGAMWKMALPGPLAAIGDAIERVIAPPLYRSTKVVTLSNSSKEEIVEQLGFDPANVTVVPPGIEARYVPGSTKCAVPTVLAVGRLVPVKRFDVLIDTLCEVKVRVPALEATIAGEGYLRPELEAQIAARGAGQWLHLAGRVSDDELVSLYQRAWIVSSTSLREGWGMTLTEGAACGTPSVATDIAGHRDACNDGASGILAEEGAPLVEAMTEVLTNASLRQQLEAGALELAKRFTWEATATAAFSVLDEVARSR